MKSTILTLAMIISGTTLAQEIQVSVTLLPKEAWGEKDKQLVEEAATKAFRNLAKAEVANCGYRNSFKENKNQLRKNWGNRMPVINKSRKVAITIHKKELRKGVLGQARVNVAEVERRHYTIKNLSIDLSQDAVHDHLSRKVKADEKDIWVNVVAHEVAHNMGFRHGSGGTWQENYPGYFVTEIGFCAMTDGRYGSKKR